MAMVKAVIKKFVIKNSPYKTKSRGIINNGVDLMGSSALGFLVRYQAKPTIVSKIIK